MRPLFRFRFRLCRCRILKFERYRPISKALLPLWGGIGQTPTAFCRPAGWDEGYFAEGGRGLHPLTPTPLPQGERGVFSEPPPNTISRCQARSRSDALAMFWDTTSMSRTTRVTLWAISLVADSCCDTAAAMVVEIC